MRRSCGGRGGPFWFLARSPLMASLVAAVPSLMAMSAPPLPPCIPFVASAGVRRSQWPPVLRPPTAPAPPIARTLMPPRVQAGKAPFAARSFPFNSFVHLLFPLTHDVRTGMASVERDHLNVGTTKVRLSRRRRVALALIEAYSGVGDSSLERRGMKPWAQCATYK